MAFFLIEAGKFVLASMLKPLFVKLLGSMANPKFLLQTFIDIAEELVKHTETKFDDKILENLKEAIKEDMDNHLKS